MGALFTYFCSVCKKWLKNDPKLNTSIFGCYWEFNKALKDHITPTIYLKTKVGPNGSSFYKPNICVKKAPKLPQSAQKCSEITP